MDPKEVRPPPERTGIPPMMQQMMERMCRAGACSPAMCQGTTSPAGKTEAAEPETSAGSCCGDRAPVEDEVLAALKTRGPLDLATLASALKISPERALDAVGKLVSEGKAALSSIRATDAAV